MDCAELSACTLRIGIAASTSTKIVRTENTFGKVGPLSFSDEQCTAPISLRYSSIGCIFPVINLPLQLTVEALVYIDENGEAMLGNLQSLVSGHHIEIHPNFQKLITQMRTAQQKKVGLETTGKLDKSKHPLDSLDALRLAVFGYLVKNE